MSPPKITSGKQALRGMLSGGDRRSIGRADEVAALVLSDPDSIGSLAQLLHDPDPLICMRAADALEKISRDHAALLQLCKPALLGVLTEATQQELRWHLALIIPRLTLTHLETRASADILQTYLTDRSSIVKTFAMQGLSDLAAKSAPLRPDITDLIRSLTRTGTPAMRARGRTILQKLETIKEEDQ